MSVSADRLRLLRRQAGHADVRAPVTVADGAAPHGAQAAPAVDADAGPVAGVPQLHSNAGARVAPHAAMARVVVDPAPTGDVAAREVRRGASSPCDAPAIAQTGVDDETPAFATECMMLSPAQQRHSAVVGPTSGEAVVVGDTRMRAASEMSATAQPPRDPPPPLPGSGPGVSAERLRLLRRQVGGLTPAARKDEAVMPTRAQRQPAPGATSQGWRAAPRDAAAPGAQAGNVDGGSDRRAQTQTQTPAMTRRPLQAPGAATPARDASVFAWVEHDVRHRPVSPLQSPSQSTAHADADTNVADAAAKRLPASHEASIAPMPASQRRTDIAGLRKMIGLRERAVSAHVPVRAASTDRHLPGKEIAPGLHLIEDFLPQPIPHEALSLAFAKREDAVDPMDLLFFDTETTGLAGGTGTRAFMIGVADWYMDDAHGSGLRVRQLMMSTVAAESAMLDLFRSWLSPQTVLSSYNGRCYDAPLLKTRYRLARRGDPISALDHVDLLFPTRRRYRGTWENCKLATIERQLLRVVREDDLPGSEAPAAWLSYLRGGSARNLRRVAEHNHQDVVTLSLLLQRLVAVDAQDREVIPMLETP
ncbi:ribonuclease H-like domain-containing protein [Xanthomonas hortorum]|uniref:YprB ribonuclease H-like domain-containing protein n=2 Tax=Xanthomonas hortorum TaxID=56454 RepID=A0A6V7BYE4_9XANT|nr:exonuclease [Xanthomonas hortorum pv. gardneri]MCE4303176.1 ribonuclease H-like domain-containing protein [Xanthomonas hortorum pv. vitians]MCC8494185.1 ribonuclease H-like domain-containing protein [Xanthomonas hortorum pv. gardneri]MCE4307053.1 ribonuclease H-like domain-containing protein [Xanthomonas hortorum pv. vitians]MCE4310129.1 ribonuclease H-like domain-containing protein [Xanthomonas hortorum pv. vitians]